MEASKSLRRPTSWQDFETLCKKLWGEIWSCPEIKKNGRPGQSQNGVDIYGIPKGENQFYGIQCKGKNEYTDKQFSDKEILKEIENAKHFKPDLKKLYFTTTALKDAHIETFIREKNIEHIKDGLFEVHLFSWEDIVDLIDENRQTHDWYLNSENFKTKKEVKITFTDDSVEIERKVFFNQIVEDYRPKMIQPEIASDSLRNYFNVGSISNFKISRLSIFETSVNLSYFSFQIKIHNRGSQPIEEYNIKLDVEGQIIDISETNESGGLPFISSIHSPLSLDPSNKKIKITPKVMLVGDDSFVSDEIFIKPKHDESKITLKWKLLAKDFTDNGLLIINIKPNIEPICQSELKDEQQKFSAKIGDIHDLLIPKELLE
jgi:hypothetical protein